MVPMIVREIDGKFYIGFRHDNLMVWAKERNIKVGFWREWWPVQVIDRQSKDAVEAQWQDEARISEYLQQCMGLLEISHSSRLPLAEIIKWAEALGHSFPKAAIVAEWAGQALQSYGETGMDWCWGYIYLNRETVCPATVLERLSIVEPGHTRKEFFRLARRNPLWMAAVEKRLARLKGQSVQDEVNQFRYAIATLQPSSQRFYGPPEGTTLIVSRPYTGMRETEVTLEWNGKRHTAWDEFTGLAGCPWWKGFKFGEQLEGIVVAQGFTYINMLGQREVVYPIVRTPLTLGHELEPVIVN